MPARRRAVREDTPARDSDDEEGGPRATNGAADDGDAAAAAANRGNDDDDGAIPAADMSVMVKNLVRVMLAHEHTRSSFKRDEFAKTVAVHGHKRCFKQVFDRAQLVLRRTFGMEMVELPARDRARHMSLTQQRRQAQTQVSQVAKPAAASASTKAWILRSTLPAKYKEIANRCFVEHESHYGAVVGLVLVAVVMSDNQTMSESRLEGLFGRLEWSPETPSGPIVDVLQKMHKQGYIERIKDADSTDGDYNLFLGPRGKLETLENRAALARLCARLYDDPAMEERIARVIADTLDTNDE